MATSSTAATGAALSVTETGTNSTAGDCIICFDKAATFLVAPCGHQCLCETCVPRVQEAKGCPVCRGPVQLCIRVFASGYQPTERKRPVSSTDASGSQDKKQKKAKKAKSARKRSASEEPLHDPHGVPPVSLPRTVDSAAQSTETQDTRVASLKAVLDDQRSSNIELEAALEELSSALGSAPTEAVLRRTRVGSSVHRLARSQAATPAARGKASELVYRWARAVLTERKMSRSSTAAGSATSRGAEAQRGEVEVLTVNMGSLARKRLARHAHAARVQHITEALSVEECIEVDDALSDQTDPEDYL